MLGLLGALLLVDQRLPGLLKAGIMLSLPLALAGYLFEVRRLYLYAAVVPLAIAGARLADTRGEWALVVAGTSILMSGAVVLAGFLRHHPVPLEAERG